MISYGAAIWGHKEFTCTVETRNFDIASISAVQNRAMRLFMGLASILQMQLCWVKWDGSHLVLDNGHQLLPFGLVCLVPIHIGLTNVILFVHLIRRELVVAGIGIFG